MLFMCTFLGRWMLNDFPFDASVLLQSIKMIVCLNDENCNTCVMKWNWLLMQILVSLMAPSETLDHSLTVLSIMCVCIIQHQISFVQLLVYINTENMYGPDWINYFAIGECIALILLSTVQHLTLRGLVMPYVDINLGHAWSRYSE